MFEQYAQAIHQRFPNLQVEGENFPPPTIKAVIAQFLSIFKLSLIGIILSEFNPFHYLNMQTPSIFTWATSNKVSDIFFFC